MDEYIVEKCKEINKKTDILTQKLDKPLSEKKRTNYTNQLIRLDGQLEAYVDIHKRLESQTQGVIYEN